VQKIDQGFCVIKVINKLVITMTTYKDSKEKPMAIQDGKAKRGLF
jgi:hypothetical protein